LCHCSQKPRRPAKNLVQQPLSRTDVACPLPLERLRQCVDHVALEAPRPGLEPGTNRLTGEWSGPPFGTETLFLLTSYATAPPLASTCGGFPVLAKNHGNSAVREGQRGRSAEDSAVKSRLHFGPSPPSRLTACQSCTPTPTDPFAPHQGVSACFGKSASKQ